MFIHLGICIEILFATTRFSGGLTTIGRGICARHIYIIIILLIIEQIITAKGDFK